MSFERLPLALALSITLLGGGLLGGTGDAIARQTLAGRTSKVIIAAKDSGDVSADDSARAKDKDKDKSKDKDKKSGDKAEADKKDSDKKDKKADKSEKAEKAAKEQATADDTDKKKGKGMFFHRKGGEEKAESEKDGDKKSDRAPDEKAKKVTEVREKTGPTEKETAKPKIEAKAAPAFIPDDALISVLKDINKALADGTTEQVQKIENSDEKMVLSMAREILARALDEPNLNANRIVAKKDERQVKSALTAESWSSGEVIINDQLRGSLAAVWAKRIGGLLTVTIAGDAGNRKSKDGTTIGEFMVVVTAHSPVQSGFDIQSQSDVTFWIGKLSNISVEANCVPSPDTASENSEKTEKTEPTASAATGTEAKKKLTVCLSPLLTDRYRKHYAALLAADLDAQKIAAALAAAADPAEDGKDTSAGTSSENSPENSSNSKSGREIAAAGDEAKGIAQSTKAAGDRETKGETEAKTASKSNAKNESQKESNSETKTAQKSDPKVAVVAANVSGVTTAGTTITNIAEAAHIVAAATRYHTPSPSSLLLMPERALAGQYVTVAILDRTRTPEADCEVTLNGSPLVTDASGQVVYQIPDDTSPGRSLNVALTARPDEVPATIEVFQPLNVTTGQPPRLDRMTPLAIKGSIMTIEGHNFDGMAHNNSVIVDGTLDGKIVSASPFQLKLLLPPGLRPGPHSLCVSTDGMRSNWGGFDFADTLVTVEGKDTGKENCPIKLMVKVIGTTAKMNVKIINQTPDVVRLNRGAEMTITSSGGFDNYIALPAVRGKRGTFQIDTQIEI